MEQLKVIKVGGKIVEEKDTLNLLLNDYAKVEGRKILVHGGGRSAGGKGPGILLYERS